MNRHLSFVGLPFFAAVLLLGACKRSDHQTTSASQVDASFPPVSQQIEAATAELSSVRGLAAKHPIKTVILGEREYRARLEAHIERMVSANSETFRALLPALGFSNPDFDASRIIGDAVDDKQVEAFYEPETDAVILRSTNESSYDARSSVAVIMAIERALQAQTFGGPVRDALDIDGRLAALALAEGDATAASIAYFARRKSKPTGDTIEKAAALLDSLPVDALATSVANAAEDRRSAGIHPRSRHKGGVAPVDEERTPLPRRAIRRRRDAAERINDSSAASQTVTGDVRQIDHSRP